jgi:hypothetical protein
MTFTRLVSVGVRARRPGQANGTCAGTPLGQLSLIRRCFHSRNGVVAPHQHAYTLEKCAVAKHLGALLASKNISVERADARPIDTRCQLRSPAFEAMRVIRKN